MGAKIISVTSVKGGVGKTTMVMNLAGIYYMLKKKVLIMDMDLFSGGISACLNLKNKKDVFMLIDSMSNNRAVSLEDYVVSYNNGIDVLASPIDPRQAMKIESKYIPIILEIARKNYDVILIDTNHILNEINLTILDYSYMTLFMIINDLVDVKNMKSMVSIFKDAKKKNFLICLNNSRDTGRDYLSMFDIRNIIKANIDYTVSSKFYIKNIDRHVMNGEILTLNSSVYKAHFKDIDNMRKMALDLINDKHGEEGEN